MGIKIRVQSRLPSAYQEVEYIESSGTQYIDTGFTPDGNTELEFDFMPTSTSGYQGYFGSDNDWNNTAFQSYNDRCFSYGNQYGSSGTYFTANTRYLLEFKNLTVSLNGSTIRTVNSATFTVPHSSLVCAVYRQACSGIANYGSEKVYSLKLWDNGSLARDFVPCYRIADSVIGLYDLVNDVFYINSGSGTFSKGADIGGNIDISKIRIGSTDIKKVYLGSTQVRPSSTPGGPSTFEDSFTGNTLDTSIWTANQYGTGGSLVVNNGLSISSGTNPGGALSNGYTISTNALFTGAETKVTAEVTYTGYSGSVYDNGSLSLLGNECRDGTIDGQPVMDSATGVIYTTWQSWGYSLGYLNGSQASFMKSYTMFSNPTTIKCVLDITNVKAEMYINGNLVATRNSILYSGKTRNDYIGHPLLTISPRYGENLTINISKIKLTTE